jgi:hypothetical protein
LTNIIISDKLLIRNLTTGVPPFPWRGGAKMRRFEVFAVYLDWRVLKVFTTMNEAADEANAHPGAVMRVFDFRVNEDPERLYYSSSTSDSVLFLTREEAVRDCRRCRRWLEARKTSLNCDVRCMVWSIPIKK